MLRGLRHTLPSPCHQTAPTTQYLSCGDGIRPAVPPAHSPADTCSGRDGQGQEGIKNQFFLTNSAIPYAIQPSPLCTLDAPEWPRPGCLGPRGSLGTQYCRHGPCCRHHPGDVAGHSMPHIAHQSGQVSGVAVRELRPTTGVAPPRPSPTHFPDDTSSPTPLCMHTCVLHMYLASMELQPSQEAFNGLDLLGERCIRRGMRPRALYPPHEPTSSNTILYLLTLSKSYRKPCRRR